MKLSDFSFVLPPGHIAQEPVEPRDSARLMVHSIEAEQTRHRQVRDLVDELVAGDLLVTNDTRVLPARLHARRASGGAVELLLLEPAPHSELGAGELPPWRAMARPAKKLRPGEILEVGGGQVKVECLERESASEGGLWHMRLMGACSSKGSVEELLERFGEMPLPPYIERAAGGREEDRERYQTVYAQRPGAVAAPTAGLHFTPELLRSLAERGVQRAQVTLHVGLGTFLPVQVDDIEQHRMHAERYLVEQDCVQAVAACRRRGGRVIAVGTTSVRALESSLDEQGQVMAGSGSTRLFIRPGYSLRAVDGLLTNFHLPGSTLLMLVSAMSGRDRLLALYEEAIQHSYRFYSYGDAMLLLP